GGDVGISRGGDGAEKSADGKDADRHQFVAEGAEADVIAYFFQRYDNIGIPNDDDLDRFWEKGAPPSSDRFQATEEKTEAEGADTKVKLTPEEKGTGDVGHETNRNPVENEAEVEAKVCAEDVQGEIGRDASVDDKSHSPDADMLTAVTGVTDGVMEVPEGGGTTNDDDAGTAGEHDGVIPNDSASAGKGSEVQGNSAEPMVGDGDQDAESGDVEERKEAESGDVKGHQEAESHDLEGKQEADSADIEGQQEADSGNIEGQQGAESRDIEGQQETESGTIEGQQEAESGDIEGQQEVESGDIEGQQEAEAGDIEGQQEAESGDIKGQQEAEAGDIKGQEAESVDIEGQQEVESGDIEGQQEAESRGIEGQQVVESGDIEGQQEAESGDIEGQQEAESGDIEGQ
ncbi:hypothetical protein LSAT2_015875, partial [Lamellibrachia satsuma]